MHAHNNVLLHRCYSTLLEWKWRRLHTFVNLWRVEPITCLAKSRNGPKMVPCLLTSTDR